MNSITIFIIALLFTVAVISPDVRASDQVNDCVGARQMRTAMDKYKACLELRGSTRSRDRSNVQTVDQEYCRELNRKLLEEIEKHGTFQQDNQDKRTDILEQLLLEHSGEAAPHPGRCQ